MPTSFLKSYAAESHDVLAAILTQSRDCIKLLNTRGEVEYMNGNGLQAIGAEGPDDVLGKTWREMWPEENRGKVDKALAAARRGRNARFEGYVPTLRGEPRWWDVSVSPVKDNGGELTHILAVSRDVTDQINIRMNDRMLREEAEREAGFAGDVAREMRHRLKNQLAVVGAVAKLLARHTETARELALKLEEKLFSLARAQDLLTIHRDRAIRADEALAQVLEASGAGERIEVLAIPQVELSDEAVQTMALILGELQTNSLKHGALRNERGVIQVSGSRHGATLSLRWAEDCGVAIEPPSQMGGGMQLITRLGGSGATPPSITWTSRGVVVAFNLRCLN